MSRKVNVDSFEESLDYDGEEFVIASAQDYEDWMDAGKLTYDDYDY